MKIRFVIVLLGVLIPVTSFAGFPSFDPMNFGVNISENLQTVLSKVETSKQVETMQATLTKVGSAKESVSSFINKQKEVIENYKAKYEKYSKDVSGYLEKAKAYANATKDIIDKAKEIKEDGVGNYLKENAGNMAGDLADKIGIDSGKVADLTDKVVDGDLKEMAGDIVGNVADQVGVDTAQVEELIGKVKNTNSSEDTDEEQQPLSLTGQGPVNSGEAKRDLVKEDAVEKENIAIPSKRAIQGGEAENVEEGTLSLVKNGKNKSVTKGIKQANKTVETTSLPEKIDTNVNLKDPSKKMVVPIAVDIKTIENSQKVLPVEAKKASLKVNTDVDKNLKNGATTLKRRPFKSSFGYGKIQNKYQLSFASLSEGMKTGSTAEGILIVPESISLNCGINYEDAIKDKEIDKCLKEVSSIAYRESDEDVSMTMIQEAGRDIFNGYVEILASSYFEALDVYNDSLTFKENEIDPIITTTTNDIDASWRIAKEMHIVLGSRFNKLRQLWARNLSMKMYTEYVAQKFEKEE